MCRWGNCCSSREGEILCMQPVEEWFATGDAQRFFDGADGHSFEFSSQGPRKVRSKQDIWMRIEPGFGGEHPRSGDIQDSEEVTPFNPGQQRVLVHQLATGRIDECGTWLEGVHQSGVEQIECGRQRGRMEAHDVTTRHQLVQDLRAEFPEMKGLSRRNLFYIRAFAAAWPDPIVQQAVAQLPWGHFTVLLDKADTRQHRDWYAGAAVEHGWSRNVLLNMIMNRTLERTGAAPSNFVQRLVGLDSELAQQVAKDPYSFEFLGLSGEVAERDLELALTSRITETLRELGPGFSFVGRQVHFDVDGDDYYIDMLFFHMDQNRYVVIELKTGKFQPEYAGKLNFYVALVDDMLRREHHNETIGILICGTKNDRSVRYSLGRSTSPMAVAAYTYDKLPAAEQQALPNEGHLVAALEWVEPVEEQRNACQETLAN